MRHLVLTLLAALALAGCGLPTRTTPSAATPATTIDAGPLVVGSCHTGSDHGQPLPDPGCTPGALNPDVTQATIGDTICRPGWTKTVRPPASVTDALKRQQLAAYGYADQVPRDYEEDHLVSLELGGAPADPHNLWPEPGASPNPKDKVENALHAAVCSGRVRLADAQRDIASDWITAEQKLGLT
ncbi:MAG TPA: hypothetical protein VFQ42_04225 [Mycobacterium sp.]|nr:hypothetical protein [Mycobacterium sp.]